MNKLSNYTNELFIEIRNDFKKLMKSGNKNNVHHFRVNLKEIFALLEFISYCYMTEKPHFKKLHKLFKHAGEIREMQILYADLKANVKIKNKKFDTLLEEIKVNSEIEFMLFKNKYQDQGDTIFNKPEIWISYALKNKPSYNIEEYFKMEQKKMLSLMLQITIDQKQIHNFRKKVKSVKYNFQGIKSIKASKFINSAALEEWDKQLGDWHDNMQIIKNLNKIGIDNTKSNPFRKQVYELTNNYKAKEQILYKTIMRKFDSQIERIVRASK